MPLSSSCMTQEGPHPPTLPVFPHCDGVTQTSWEDGHCSGLVVASGASSQQGLVSMPNQRALERGQSSQGL